MSGTLKNRFLRPDSLAVLYDEKAKKSLRRYFAIIEGNKPAKFVIAKRLPAVFNKHDSLEELWQKHASLTERFLIFERDIDSGKKTLEEMPVPNQSYLDLKILIAEKILSACHFCHRRCQVDRLKEELGYCKCGQEMRVSSIFAHMGEEPELVPSGTIFTLGCTMRCKHCQNWSISQWEETGEILSLRELATQVDQLRSNGCRNINLVGGEPTPWLQQWLIVFKHVTTNVPVVWNSNSYYSPETARLLAGFIDIYLLDFKYGPQKCAEKISDSPGYWKVCTHNHLEAKKYGETITRILVLPGHIKCCTKSIVDWLAENLGAWTRVNIMFQYRPEWRAREVPELKRRLTKEEMQRAIDLAEETCLTNFIT